MALSAEDYAAPNGDLHIPLFWPRLDGESEGDRDDRALEDIEAWRVQAYAKTTSDDLSRLWVNYRAWSRFADILSGIPSSASNDEGSRTYAPGQAEYWRTKAEAALEEFEAGAETGGEYDTIQSYR